MVLQISTSRAFVLVGETNTRLNLTFRFPLYDECSTLNTDSYICMNILL